jgi:hypothetical protein
MSQNRISDPAVEFFKKLRNKAYVSESLDSFKSGKDSREVSLSSDHAAYRFLKGLKSNTSNTNVVESKKSNISRDSLLMECSCGKEIKRPSNGCSIMCRCGKIHS